MQIKKLWEILVPTVMNLKPVRTRYHRVWDKKVREITGGLTILNPVKGQWKADDGTNHIERVIPVRIACTKEEMDEIAKFTAKYYKQKAVMYYLISSEAYLIEGEK